MLSPNGGAESPEGDGLHRSPRRPSFCFLLLLQKEAKEFWNKFVVAWRRRVALYKA